ncbi:MAG: phosphate acyltransferase PlsX [Thermoleophilia bacterium]|nr:phosphate acyltransferase PlsX [Thermoleophilia bacterium]
MSRVRVALDAMGGDDAPRTAVHGGLLAASPDLTVLLVGDQVAIAEELTRHEGLPGRGHVVVVHAPDRVTGSEDGARAARAKPDSSVVLACRQVKDGAADAAVSMGNTGAMMAASVMHIRRAPGVLRPAIATVIPSGGGYTVLLDAGANAEAKPEHLRQFALMGRLLAQTVLGRPEPTIGLLSIGEEPERGTEMVQAAHQLLRDVPGFVGNVEGRDIPRGTVDVVVTDGFTGNVALKLYESAAGFLFEEMRAAAMSSVRAKVGGALLRPALRRMRDRLDPDLYGGAMLLGVRGPAVIGHGSGNEVAVRHAVEVAARAVRENVIGRISAELERLPGAALA